MQFLKSGTEFWNTQIGNFTASSENKQISNLSCLKRSHTILKIFHHLKKTTTFFVIFMYRNWWCVYVINIISKHQNPITLYFYILLFILCFIYLYFLYYALTYLYFLFYAHTFYYMHWHGYCFGMVFFTCLFTYIISLSSVQICVAKFT